MSGATPLYRRETSPFCIMTAAGDDFALVRSICGTDGDEDKAEMHERACRLMACWNATADIPVEALEAGVVAKLVEALEGLIDDEPCWYDHHGYCQAHFVSSPCEMATARATLALAKGEAA